MTESFQTGRTNEPGTNDEFQVTNHQPPATVLVSGTAGFIGWKTSQLLLDEGHTVIGVDNHNDADDPQLKRWRLG